MIRQTRPEEVDRLQRCLECVNPEVCWNTKADPDAHHRIHGKHGTEYEGTLFGVFGADGLDPLENREKQRDFHVSRRYCGPVAKNF